MLTSFPSATALALALGARLTLRGLTLRRNPWTFGVRVSHPHRRYSCQHSRFRYLHTRSRAVLRRPTERSATTSEDRDQVSGIRTAAREALQHAGDLPIFARPALSDIGSDIAEVAGIESPDLHLIGRTGCHHHKTPSSQNDGTRSATDAACQTLWQCWHRSILTPAGSDRRGQTAQSSGIRGSHDALPATADSPAETPRDPRTRRAHSLISDP
jgi:hypothetical protein